MSIVNRLQTAEKHILEKDYENALIQALMAVAATSRKRYPRNGGKGDAEAFRQFLKDDFWSNAQPNISILRGYVKVWVGGKMQTFEQVIYEYARCHLFHEAEIAPELTFLPIDGIYLKPLDNTLEIRTCLKIS